MGFALRGEGTQLFAFARFAQENEKTALTMDTMMLWVQGASKPGPVTAARRVEVLRPFLKHCRQFDPQCPLIPLDHCGPAHRRPIPPLAPGFGLGYPAAACPRPRIHDLRHTFNWRALLRGQQGHQCDRATDAIATYVGHAKVSDTYWYVSATPELMGEASQRFARFRAGGGQ